MYISPRVDNYLLQELEGLADPMRKEVASVRKRIDLVNRELRPLGQSCLKKVNYQVYFIKSTASF